MKISLPSIASLRAFEAVGRHRSFTRAATELSITQGAVSQRIAALESLVEGRLFLRDGNAIFLTPLGLSFMPSACEMLTRLASATDKAVERQRGNTLSIRCLAGFAARCLIPKLPAFKAAHPDLSIRLQSFAPNEYNFSGRESSHDYGLHEFDVCIHFGWGTWPGMVAYKLRDENVFPVYSPSVRGKKALRKPKDLESSTVILTSNPITGYNYWQVWQEEAGISDLQFAQTVFCDPLHAAIQAAVDGLGVVMGRSSLVETDLREGRLIRPFKLQIKSPLSYYVLVPQEKSDAPKIEIFRQWCRKTFGLVDLRSDASHKVNRRGTREGI